jgi:hypothetical protein
VTTAPGRVSQATRASLAWQGDAWQDRDRVVDPDADPGRRSGCDEHAVLVGHFGGHGQPYETFELLDRLIA